MNFTLASRALVTFWFGGNFQCVFVVFWTQFEAFCYDFGVGFLEFIVFVAVIYGPN